MLKVGEYVSFKRPGETYPIKGIIVKVNKGLTGKFSYYYVATEQGNYKVHIENLKQPDIYPKLAKVVLETDKMLEQATEISQKSDAGIEIYNMWKATIKSVNKERHNFNMSYLRDVLKPNVYHKFLKDQMSKGV